MRPALVVVDSIQTATVDELDGAAGSLGQVREATLRLMEFAKGEAIAVVLVGHVTKDGSIAGPKTMEHLVDAVVALEGERYAALRLVRASKNRFGSTDEVGVFEMAGEGLVEVSDPARAFLADHAEPAAGSVIAPTMEGSRPLLVEVQALVAPAGYGTPARKASGVDPNRLGPAGRGAGSARRRRARVARRLRQPCRRAECRRAGPRPAAGPRPGLVAARPPACRRRPSRSVRSGCSGELRSVAGLERRLREAARLGFEHGDRAAAGAGCGAGRGAAACGSWRSPRCATRSRRPSPEQPGVVAMPSRRC